MNTNPNPNNTGTWNGWTEPQYQFAVLDGYSLMDCPYCNRQPHYTRNRHGGYPHILTCGCGELETVPCRTLTSAVDDWNQMATMAGTRMAEETRRQWEASEYLKLAKLTRKLRPNNHAQIRKLLAKSRELRTA